MRIHLMRAKPSYVHDDLWGSYGNGIYSPAYVLASVTSQERMIRWCFLVSLGISLPFHAIGQQANNLTSDEQLGRPYVALFDTFNLPSSPRDVKLLRPAIEHDRKQEIQNCEKNKKHLQSQLESVRGG